MLVCRTSLDLELLVTLGELAFELAGSSRMCWHASSNLIHRIVTWHAGLSTTSASIDIIAFTASAKLIELCEVLQRPIAEVMKIIKWRLLHTFNTVPHVIGYRSGLPTCGLVYLWQSPPPYPLLIPPLPPGLP